MVSKARKLVSNDNDYSLNFMFIIFQGFSYLKSGGFHHALDLFQNAFSLAKVTDNSLFKARSLFFQGFAYGLCGQFNNACSFFSEGLSSFRVLNDPLGIFLCEFYLGIVNLLDNKINDARKLFEGCKVFADSADFMSATGLSVFYPAGISLKSGDIHGAISSLEYSFYLFNKTGLLSLAKESALGLVESYFKLVSFYICNKKNRLCQDMVNKALCYFDSVDPQVFLFVFINSCLIPSLKVNIEHVVPLLKVVEHLEGALPFAWAVKTFNTVKAILSFFSSGKKISCFNCVGPVESLLIAPLVSRVECSNYDPFNGFV